MELSIQIKKYRTELHLSQEELAEKVYVTRQTISKVNSFSHFFVDKRKEIAYTLNIKLFEVKTI